MVHTEIHNFGLLIPDIQTAVSRRAHFSTDLENIWYSESYYQPATFVIS